MKHATLFVALFGVAVSAGAAAGEKSLGYTKVWTHAHSTPGQVSEIPAFDPRTDTLWVAGVVGVDVLDAETGELIEHIDVTASGFVNSVAVHNGLAAFAVEAASSPTSGDRRAPGRVLFYDTKTRQPSAGIGEITVGSLPDMLTFTHDGSKLLVANEGTPNLFADADYQLGAADPLGSVSIIDMETRTLITNASFAGVPQYGSNLRTNVGMDFEPEYIAVDQEGELAYVTLQEANGVAVLDLGVNAFAYVVGLGAKDFSVPGNEIDPLNNGGSPVFQSVAARGLYMPDSIALHQWRGETYTVLANEGDFREDNVDRATAGSTYGAAAPLQNLRVSRADSSSGSLFAAGARSFSIRDAGGNLIYDSGSILDRAAAAAGIYDDGRSRDKGVEPEGVAVLDVGGRTYAFIGLERTTTAAVAIFDITNPTAVEYVDLIVTAGDVSPEGLAAYHHRGNFYLAIANEVSNTTSLYLLEKVKPNGK